MEWEKLNSDGKLNFLAAIDCDIYCIQEIWKHVNNLEVLGSVLSKKVRENQGGGGTGTISARYHQFVSEKEFTLNKDSNLIKLRTQGTHIWIGNIYLPLW